MPRFWRERYDARKHTNEMKGAVDGEYQLSFDLTPHDPLVDMWVFFVEVCQFKFQFLSLRQLEVCLDYFEKKLPGPNRIPGGIGAADHWEVQRWYERLPKGLRNESKRPRIVSALTTALAHFREEGVEGPLGAYPGAATSGKAIPAAPTTNRGRKRSAARGSSRAARRSRSR